MKVRPLKILFCTCLIFFLLNKDVAASKNPTKEKMRIKIKDVMNLASTYGKLMWRLIKEKKVTTKEILEEIRVVRSGMSQIEEILHTQYDNVVTTLNTLSLKNDVKVQQDRFNRHAGYIIYQYRKMVFGLNNGEGDVVENSTLLELARASTAHGDHSLPNYVREFVELIVPSINPDGGLLNLYSKYVATKDQQHELCDNGQSFSDFIYRTFRYAFDIISKGFIVMLESYAIRRTFNEGNFTAEIKFVQDEYEAAAEAIATNLNRIADGASTTVRRCDPPLQEKGKTYLEMEKLFQGIVVDKLTMNEQHTGYYDCDYYKDQGTGYFPYTDIRHDGDWTCHGKMYNCFKSYAVNLCKPTTPNRRIDGFTAKNRRDWDWGEKVADNMGNLTNCKSGNMWEYFDWDNPNYWTTYDTTPCACICDDYKHWKTLRNFSRTYAVSDYRNNMVVTGMRFVNISNVIYIDIQQGKLEEFGFINSSTVEWRPQSEIANEPVNSSPRGPISLSYHKRRVHLDTILAEPSEVIIGASFEWDPEEKGIMVSALVSEYSFPTGELRENRIRSISNTQAKTELKPEHPHMPTLCPKNVPIREKNKFVNFQTTDWIRDAAQTTIPYLDIQEVVTNPPTLLRGVGLTYKKAPDCGGYISPEVYTHDTANWIYYNSPEHSIS